MESRRDRKFQCVGVDACVNVYTRIDGWRQKVERGIVWMMAADQREPLT